jgi:hypothetical protein
VGILGSYRDFHIHHTSPRPCFPQDSYENNFVAYRKTYCLAIWANELLRPCTFAFEALGFGLYGLEVSSALDPPGYRDLWGLKELGSLGLCAFETP